MEHRPALTMHSRYRSTSDESPMEPNIADRIAFDVESSRPTQNRGVGEL